MTTETSEQTTAQARKARAAEHVQTLTAEREQLSTRQHTASAEAERLDGVIAAAVQARDESALAALRTARQGQQDTIDDLGRILAATDQDLDRAQTELRTATIACHSETYNQLVDQQRALTETISAAFDTMTKALEVKEGLARKQDNIQVGAVGRPYTELSPADLRRVILEEITTRLQKTNRPTELRALDWTCRRMRDDGDLEQA